MKNNPIFSKIEYWLLFCPRYRRKIFLDKEVLELTLTSMTAACDALHIELLDASFGEDYCYVHVTGDAAMSPLDIAYQLKRKSSDALTEAFSVLRSMNNVWTRNSYITTRPIPEEEIDAYVALQKRRG